ncbi:MAG: methyltransferase domain-containing protein [Coriobacteriales bacterium]|jgi:SAM-dependent methyltransferase|nr:methyltransferase domain-containing protein [Coriobacteriales bacterium]
MTDILNQVKEYYGKTLASSKDLKSNACCCSEESMPREVRKVLPLIADEICDRFYGCGSPLPALLEGAVVLDLGCGTGRDVYVASKLVGEKGRVIGVDMTTEQIDTARAYLDYHKDKFGYQQTNVEFHQGYIEDLASLGIADESIDVVISNCVINLSPQKELVFREVFRVLKPGGELYFSDVFADRRVPEELSSDSVLHGECLGGALYREDFRRVLAKVGWPDFRYMSSCPITLDNDEIAEKVGMVNYRSCTVRAFKLASLEDICEDYGQVAYYLGTIPGHPHYFDLDDHHRFFTGQPMLVCGNSAAMLQDTRFGRAFKVTGDRSVHYGAFDCSGSGNADGGSGSCCC